jgi:hypothetical protein
MVLKLEDFFFKFIGNTVCESSVWCFFVQNERVLTDYLLVIAGLRKETAELYARNQGAEVGVEHLRG